MLLKLSFKIFLYCMLTVASIIIIFIWNNGPPSDVWAQATATLVIIGLASFLVWFSNTLISIKKLIEK
jgi:hypothetical protein